MAKLDVDDLMAFSKRTFGSYPRPHQVQAVKAMLEGKEVVYVGYSRAIGKTWAVNLAKEYNKYIKEKNNDPTNKQNEHSITNNTNEGKLR